MPFEKSQTEQGTVLWLKDEVTVAEAAELKNVLSRLTKDESCFALDVGQTTELDTAIMQLIFSASKFAKEQGVEMSLTGHSEALDSAMKRTGLNLVE
ncbi:MAG: STAS domain-containing protein [Thermodesulfobacteriota bacterium]|nr:STAS domain-containing protein [Thermodesulfobacteriota bacterium]